MRSMMLLGIAMVGAAGCDTTRHSTVNCSPCKSHTTSCPVTPASPATPAAPGKPATLPPTIKEVRGEDPEPRQFASAPAATTTSFSPSFIPPPAPLPATTPAPPVASQGDVLLIPRWVYVPYSPHTPNGPSKLPANVAGPQFANPYVQTENGMTVLPPMGAGPAPAPAMGPQLSAQQTAMMEQIAQQMKVMNQRMSDLEAKATVKPATPAAPIAAPATPAAPAAPAAPAFLPPPQSSVAPAFLPPPSSAPVFLPPPAASAPTAMLPLPTPVPMIPPAK